MTSLTDLIDKKIVGDTQTYTHRDTCLYALGCGLGADPTDTDQLRFVYEQAPGFAALPTYPVVLGDGGFWLSDPVYGVDWSQVLHGEQGITLHTQIPVAATVRSTSTVTDIIDKGAEKGAFIYTSKDIHCVNSDTLLATLTSTIVARGNGGFGGPQSRRDRVAPPKAMQEAIPETSPDITVDIRSQASAGLLYRLSGDLNPLHASPEAAKSAGFSKPILHGLCTLGYTGHVLLKHCCQYNTDAIRSLSVRFTAPVYPGDTLRVNIWQASAYVFRFQTRSVERDCIVIDQGILTTGKPNRD